MKPWSIQVWSIKKKKSMSNDINETMHGVYKYGHALINSDLGYQQWDSKFRST